MTPCSVFGESGEANLCESHDQIPNLHSHDLHYYLIDCAI
jgi:hypothetical protein